MTSRAALFLAGLCAIGNLCGCGGNVTVGTGGAGGSGANGGAGGGMGGNGGSSSTVSPVGGAGGSVSSSVGGAGGGECTGLDHISCLGAFPSCVPVYDDECCPSCDPMGGCADCIRIQFHHCTPIGSACNGGPSCGETPEWACNGKQADCNIDPAGSQIPCATRAGCIPAYCAVDADCTTDPVCHPATAGSCITQCDAIPPDCAPGTYPESDGFCYTGLCIPENLCVIGL